MKKVLVKGPLLSRSGYGEHARFVLRSLRKYPEHFDIYLMNTKWGSTSQLFEDSEERRFIDGCLGKTMNLVQQAGPNPQGALFDIFVQVAIPNEFERLAPYCVGVTAGVETTKISQEWAQGVMTMDKIIVPSEFAKFAFENSIFDGADQNGKQFKFNVLEHKTFDVVSYPLKATEPGTLDIKFDHDFNFLVVAQNCLRKNTVQTIKEFVEEFYDQPVGLVLKMNTATNSLMDFQETKIRLQELLHQYSDKTCSVHLLHGDMSDEEMAALYTHPQIKCLVNIAHGEGFGLPIFEATGHALPVLTINWGGQKDFLSIPDAKGKFEKMATFVSHEVKPIQPEAVWDKVIIKDSEWAFPASWDYKVKLRSVYKAYGEKKALAKRLAEYNRQKFGGDKMLRRMAESILGEEIADLGDVPTDQIPKISIITSVFKAEEYITEFLKDVERQTIFKDKVELVLVNPGSPEQEKEVIKEWVEKYPDIIKYVELDKDPGLYACWNEAIRQSTGALITNWNCDDRRAPDALEKMAKTLLLSKDVSMVYYDNFITNKPNETFETNSSNGRKYSMEPFSKEALLRSNLPHCGPMWRREVHDRIGFFNEDYRSAADWEFNLRLAFAGLSMKKIGSPLGLYYFSPRGISTDPKNNSWKRKEEREIYTKFSDVLKKEKEALTEPPVDVII